MTNEITKENYNPRIHVAEYKRICNECGKVWHSLVEREKAVEGDVKYQAVQGCMACGDRKITTQTDRNQSAQEDVLSKLRKCPQCSSANYEETIIYYEKQK